MLPPLAEFIENPETRCPAALVLDTSASMKGKPIAELNAGVRAFFDDIRADPLASLRVELGLICFGGGARLERDFATLDIGPVPELAAGGNTPLGAALHLAIDALEYRVNRYRAAGIAHYRPWLFLITDGRPTDGIAWQLAAQRAQMADLSGNLAMHPIGVANADMRLLGELASPLRPPIQLKGLNFRDLFDWMSRSMRHVSLSRIGGRQPGLPALGDWAVMEGPSP